MTYREEKNIQEFEPITMAGGIVVGLTFLVINLALALFMGAAIANKSKKDSERTRRINTILKNDKILKGNKKWSVYILKEDQPNAFCIITPHIFLTSGIVKLLNERELTAVMLHEAGHIKNKDTIKMLIRDNTLMAIILGVAGGLAGPAGLMIVGLIYVYLGSGLLSIIFNRTMGRFSEKRADSFAVKYGYTKEMVSALEKLDKYMQKELQKEKCGRVCKVVSKINEKLDEHPPLKERVENILKSEETWKMSQKLSFTNLRNFFMKKFNVAK